LHDLLTSNPGGTSGGGINEQPNEVNDPTVELVEQFEPLVRQFAGRYLSQGATPEDAWRRAKQEILTYPNGRKLVNALERGDLTGALKLLPTVVRAN
jgi:hypothetical protein